MCVCVCVCVCVCIYTHVHTRRVSTGGQTVVLGVMVCHHGESG